MEYGGGRNTLDSDEVSADEDSDARDLSEVDTARLRPSPLFPLSCSDLETPLEEAGMLVRLCGWAGGFFSFLMGSSMSVGPPDTLGVPLTSLGDWMAEPLRATGTPSPPSTDWIFLSWAVSTFCREKKINKKLHLEQGHLDSKVALIKWKADVVFQFEQAADNLHNSNTKWSFQTSTLNRLHVLENTTENNNAVPGKIINMELWPPWRWYFLNDQTCPDRRH